MDISQRADDVLNLENNSLKTEPTAGNGTFQQNPSLKKRKMKEYHNQFTGSPFKAE
jgi:hypothetical protein